MFSTIASMCAILSRILREGIENELRLSVLPSGNVLKLQVYVTFHVEQ